MKKNALGAGMNPAGCRVSEMVLSGQLEAVEGGAIVAEAATRAGLERDEAERTAWNGNVSKRDVGGAIPIVHLLGDWSIGLSTWQLWHSSEGTQGVTPDALIGPAQSHYYRLLRFAAATLIFRRTEVA